MNKDTIEITISKRKFQIKLEGFSSEARDEIFEKFHNKDVELTDLLKAYLSKIQDYSVINSHLEGLLEKIAQ